MAVQPAGQVEEETPAEGQTSMPTTPAPVMTTQTVSQGPSSLQAAPAPAQGVSTTPAPPEPVMSRTARPAAYATTTTPEGKSTTTQTAPAEVVTSAPKAPKAAKAEATPVTPDPSTLQSEFIARFMDSFSKSAEGKDPVAAAEFNSFIQMNGPSKALAMEGMAMRLKQSGNDGPGAGDALLQMFARDLEFSEDQVFAQISAKSAQRIHDMNKWGVEKAFQLVKEEKEFKRNQFNDAVTLGQWDIVGNLGQEIFGFPVDIGALKAADPATKTLVTNGMNTMNTLIEQGKPEEAKAMALSIASSNPEAFGFTNPADAVAAVGKMDFNYEAWANLQDRVSKTQEAARTSALSGDEVGLRTAIDNWALNLPPGSIDGMGASILKNDTLEEINSYREAAGKSPITESERGSLSASEIAKDKELARTKTSSQGMNGVDLVLKDLLDAVPGLKANAKATADTRRWVAEQQLGTGANPLPPYDPNSQTVHFYADWPVVMWTDGVPSGSNFDFEIDDNSGAGQRDLTTVDGKRQQGLDTAYNTYLSNIPKEQRLSARDWFTATQGGTRDVPKDQAPTIPGAEPEPDNSVKPLTPEAVSAATTMLQETAAKYPKADAKGINTWLVAISNQPNGSNSKLAFENFFILSKRGGIPDSEALKILETAVGAETIQAKLGVGTYATLKGAQ